MRDVSSKLIVGLGNPGTRYRSTRHNLGFLVVDELAKELKVEFKKHERFHGEVAKAEFDGQTIYLLKPHTYMNESGLSVRKCIDFYKIKARDVLVVVDDVAFAFEELRLKPKGSSGGHNGLKNIERHIGSEYPRLKMGIGQPPSQMALEDYVLAEFNTKEVPHLGHFIHQAALAIELWLKEGLEKAMNQVNTKEKMD